MSRDLALKTAVFIPLQVMLMRDEPSALNGTSIRLGFTDKAFVFLHRELAGGHDISRLLFARLQ